MIVNAFENKVFPFYSGNYYYHLGEEETSESDTVASAKSSPDLSESASPRSSSDLSKSISPRGSSDLSKSDKSHESNEFGFTADDLDKMYIGNADDLDKLLLDTEKYLDPDLTKKYFFNKSLKKVSEFLKPRKDKSYDKIEVALIKNRLKDLKRDIKYMPENEVKNKKLDLLAGRVKKILDINGLLNIPGLKSEESAEQRQRVQGLKILPIL